MNEIDHTLEYDTFEINQMRLFNALCYLGPLWLIPLIFKRNVSVVRFHLNQGIILILADLFMTALRRILVLLIPVGMVQGILGLVFTVINVIIFAVMVLQIINAVHGIVREIPFIGKYKIIKYKY